MLRCQLSLTTHVVRESEESGRRTGVTSLAGKLGVLSSDGERMMNGFEAKGVIRTNRNINAFNIFVCGGCGDLRRVALSALRAKQVNLKEKLLSHYNPRVAYGGKLSVNQVLYCCGFLK